MILNFQLRKNAREQLGGNIFANNWLIVLAVLVVCSFVLGAGTIVSFILSGPILYGVCRFMIDMACGKDYNLETLLCGFKESFGNALVLDLLVKIYSFLCSLLFIIPGIVKLYAYSMSMYILQDNPDMQVSECINESQRMMLGKKLQLFCLDLSFLGWYIVGLLCFGVGVFFVAPYHQMARTNFYLALKARREE